MAEMEPVRIIVRGVSGSGKSTLGGSLASALGLPSVEAVAVPQFLN